jgi:hypothetical protein
VIKPIGEKENDAFGCYAQNVVKFNKINIEPCHIYATSKTTEIVVQNQNLAKENNLMHMDTQNRSALRRP